MPHLEVSDVNLYYETEGIGEPLVLISGWSRAERSFGHHISEFLEQYYCVRYDKRGMGRADSPDEFYTIRTMAEDLNELLDHLDIENARIVGMAMGSLIGMELAINHPEKVRSLVLGSPCIKADNFLREIMQIWKDIRKYDVELWAREVNLWCYTPESYNTEPEMTENAWKRRVAGKTFTQPWAFDRTVDAYLSHDVTHRVEQIETPTLVLSGGDEDLFSGPRYAKAVQESIPDAELVIFDNTSHNYHVEAKEKWGEVVMDWLART